MSDGIKQFQSAKAKGPLEFRIDDEVFRRKPVTVDSADVVAELGGQLPSDGGEHAYTSDELMSMVRPFIMDDDWERFDKYVRSYVEIVTFTEIARWLIEVSTGTHPSRPASSPDGSSTTGGPSSPGVSGMALPTPSGSPSGQDSLPPS